MKIEIGLLGFGTVGKGVYDILQKNKEEIFEKSGLEFEVKKVLVRDVKKHSEFKEVSFTDNYREIVNDENIKIVVELIGGDDLAFQAVMEAIEKGKSVITANKAILAKHARQLINFAEEKGCDIFFEASVAGSIPIIKILKESLTSNRINSIYGILNGTANFILSKMTNEKREFNEVLKEAIEKGYAEADPTLDIEGFDACHKLAIISSIAFKTDINFRDIHTEGISKISVKDIKFAEELGFVIKLLGIAKQKDSGIEVRVHPTLVDKNSLLARVQEANNAVFLEGDFCGKQFYFGKGAGRYPTASVVVSDIIEAGINIKKGCRARRPIYGVVKEYFKKARVLDIGEVVSKYYLRFNAVDRPGVLSKISGVLGKYNISIEAVIQKGRDINNRKGSVPIVMITHECYEKDIRKALIEINHLDVVKENTVLLRIEENI